LHYTDPDPGFSCHYFLRQFSEKCACFSYFFDFEGITLKEMEILEQTSTKFEVQKIFKISQYVVSFKVAVSGSLPVPI